MESITVAWPPLSPSQNSGVEAQTGAPSTEKSSLDEAPGGLLTPDASPEPESLAERSSEARGGDLGETRSHAKPS